MSWRDVIPERDRALSERSGRGRRLRPGDRPAVVLVDMTYGFTGRGRRATEEAMSEYPNACGQPGWLAVDCAARIRDAARLAQVPVIYTAGLGELRRVGGGPADAKHGRRHEQPADADEIVSELAPGPGEMVIRKARPSAFFGTPLLTALLDAGRDTVVIAGGTTSGCVRATAVDAFSYGFRVLVVEDAVFDRAELSHAVNLFDMDQKYANVQSAEAVLAYLAGLSKETR